MSNKFTNAEQRERWNQYNNQYAKAHYKSICLKLNRETDKDIINYVENSGKSYIDVLRTLVRKNLGK